jgi:Tol biopolymer transport system component
MRKFFKIFFIVCVWSGIIISHLGGQSGIGSGPYLGQKSPGKIPAVFCPGILSTDGIEFTPSFSPEGKECFFTRMNQKKKLTLMRIRQVNGIWQEPVEAPFNSVFDDADLLFSPDGERVYFWSNRPLKPGHVKKDADLWMTEKHAGRWGKPKNLGSSINNDDWQIAPTVASSGNLYFASYRYFSKKYEENFGKMDLYMSTFTGGKYAEPVNPGKSINTPDNEKEPFVAPDERYIIFNSDRLGGQGNYDLYISFKTETGTWSKAVNLGEEINSSSWEGVPFVTFDRKYLFFSSDRSGNSDI